MSRLVETDSARVKEPEITENPIAVVATTTVAIQINDSETLDVNTESNQLDQTEAAGAIFPQIQRKKFVEKPNQNHDSFEYPRNGSDPGLVVIFNQEEFVSDHPTRQGTVKDVENLIVTLGRLGFNIHEEFIFYDLTRKEILDEVDNICELDHSSRNCLIVIFLTHGGKEDTLFAKDAELQTKDIWEKFAQCPTLTNKPKLFIFQACKGNKMGKAFNDERNEEHVEEDKIEIVPKNIFSTPPTPHILLVYASIEGNVSFRDPERGTWFIQELCRNFLAYGRRDDVISLIIRTSKCVATYDTTDQNNTYKQMPTFISTLTKNFYLIKSKDRNITLGFKKKQDEIEEILHDLKARVNILHEARMKRRSK